MISVSEGLVLLVKCVEINKKAERGVNGNYQESEMCFSGL